MVIGSIPFFFNARILVKLPGTIEGFLSPSALPAFIKTGTGVLTGIVMYSYLFLVGREGKDLMTELPPGKTG